MFYKFKSEKSLEKFKDNSFANNVIGKELGLGIFSAKVCGQGSIYHIEDTDLGDVYDPIFKKEEVDKYLVVLSERQQPLDDVNSWKNCLLVTRTNLMYEIHRIDDLLSKMN